MKRYPLQPLAAAVGLSLSSLGRYLSVSGKTWKEYRDLGVSELVADRLAVKCGLVSYEVWPELLDDAIEAVTRTCAARGCDGEFMLSARYPRKRFCSDRCRSREGMRRRYQENPEPKRAAVRAYDDRERAYKKGENRRRYRENREARLAYAAAHYAAKRGRLHTFSTRDAQASPGNSQTCGTTDPQPVREMVG